MIAVFTAKVSKNIKGAYTDGLSIVQILPAMQSGKVLGQPADTQHVKSSFDGAAIRWFGTKSQA